MALESTTKIKGLNASSPTATDPVSQGDDHLRMIKDVLKKSFPSDVDAHVPQISGSAGHYLHTNGTTIDWTNEIQSVNIRDSVLFDVVMNNYREKVNVIASQSGNVTIDATVAQIQVLSVTGDMTITMAADTGLSLTLAVTKSDGVITWPSNIKWSGGVPPVLDNAEHVLTFFAVNNSSWFGFVSGANMS